MPTANVQPRSENGTTGRTSSKPPKMLTAVRTGLGFLSRVTPEGAARVAEHLFFRPRRHPRPTFERKLLAGAEPLVLSTRRGPMAAWEWSPNAEEWPWLTRGPHSPRVLLIHGWEGRGAQLGALVEPLTSLGFHVATFDAPAHGDSPGTTSSFFHFADAIAHAAEALGPFDAIVTHSMGGASALWASRQRALANRIVMIAPPVDLRDFTRNAAGILGLTDEVRERLNERIAERFHVNLEAVRAETIAARMEIPLLVIHDENDREVPVACGEAIAKAWPHGEMVRTAGLGHHRILRDPATIRNIVQFVAKGIVASA